MADMLSRPRDQDVTLTSYPVIWNMRNPLLTECYIEDLCSVVDSLRLGTFVIVTITSNNCTLPLHPSCCCTLGMVATAIVQATGSFFRYAAASQFGAALASGTARHFSSLDPSGGSSLRSVLASKIPHEQVGTAAHAIHIRESFS